MTTPPAWCELLPAERSDARHVAGEFVGDVKRRSPHVGPHAWPAEREAPGWIRPNHQF